MMGSDNRQARDQASQTQMSQVLLRWVELEEDQQRREQISGATMMQALQQILKEEARVLVLPNHQSQNLMHGVMMMKHLKKKPSQMAGAKVPPNMAAEMAVVAGETGGLMTIMEAAEVAVEVTVTIM